jgi:hypothetical protein
MKQLYGGLMPSEMKKLRQFEEGNERPMRTNSRLRTSSKDWRTSAFGQSQVALV